MVDFSRGVEWSVNDVKPPAGWGYLGRLGRVGLRSVDIKRRVVPVPVARLLEDRTHHGEGAGPHRGSSRYIDLSNLQGSFHFRGEPEELKSQGRD